jgi:uncharacterized protein (DUF58 family)
MSAATSAFPHDDPVTLVWIDARRAVVATWQTGEPHLETILADIPPRDRSIGHVRLDPAIRHGGGQRQDKLDHRRTERVREFLDRVQAAIPTQGRAVVIGPGEMRHHLLRRLRETSGAGALPREVTSEPAKPMTDSQIVARLRELAGHPAPRLKPAPRA